MNEIPEDIWEAARDILEIDHMGEAVRVAQGIATLREQRDALVGAAKAARVYLIGVSSTSSWFTDNEDVKEVAEISRKIDAAIALAKDPTP